jgi:hypothetical protein
MGNLHSAVMAESVADGLLDLKAALQWHLRGNHYPPLPLALVETAETVIKLAQQGETDARVELPAGVTWRGQREAPVWACVREWHLSAFVEVTD